MDKQFFTRNRKKLYETLEDQSLTILFAGEAAHQSADESYPFYPNRNFYYLTGITEPKIVFVATKYGGQVHETLFIQRADPWMARWYGETITADEAREASGIENIELLDKLDSFIRGEFDGRVYRHLYADLEAKSWEFPSKPSNKFAAEAAVHYPYLTIHNLYPVLSNFRVIKSPEEIEQIRKAGQITADGIRHVLANARPGMREFELEAYFNFILKSRGVTEFAFPTILASGYNGTILHYSANTGTATDGSLVLLDLGAQYNYYNGDISYTFPVNGRFTPRQKQIYDIVLRCNRAITKKVRPGLPFKELNQFTIRFFTEELLKIGLIKKPEDVRKYYFHGVSHSLGLDTHDVGNYRETKLAPGEVITNEPGLYIPEESIGIRIEDDILCTEDGYEVLTEGLPRTTDEIETYMAEHNTNMK
ncbi:aminopeptidase P family protein [Sporolactobacillus sp. THM19-2]|jgi:Xaa-Pro aminopeptidase|uniref:aminopeptidase P family protein n=1 Tax=Sporolactobacillus sp. THM19-2 TaxID=2511171 RepID=UPI00102003BC|nr:aminopeptidase P family protein [Sporolactobacillus sp. THM19-2]RYL93693.1 aminopeptidase P family protein [Sporolactobacillus sp. THM19-2]